jgi:Secretion system C-terminal sorting domain
MKFILKFILVFTLIFSGNTFSQGRDNYWPIGYASNSTHPWAGGMKLTFPNNIAVLDTHSREMWFVYTNATICNDTGSLQFYTNGVYIANALDDTMKNGSGINPSIYTTQFKKWGLRIPQGSITIPEPSSDSIYYLFHETLDFPSPLLRPNYLYLSKINMNADFGNGEVFIKNKILLTDTLLAGGITVARHGNGRDWWLLVPRYGIDIGYHTLLVTGDSIYQTNSQIFPFDGTGIGQSCFSPDGSKYMISYWWGVAFFDFDRCSGALNFIDNKVFPDSAFCLGASISPNSRYAYLTHGGFELLQYDLQSPNILASETVVATLDTFQAPAGWDLHFWMHQLGPDGKIYINTTSTTMAMHIIDDPDSVGVACDVQQHALLLPKFNATIPNFPNYNLGALTGSLCDTITGINHPQLHKIKLKIFPNPTEGNFSITYSLPQNQDGILEIMDMSGRIIHVHKLPQWSTHQQIQIPSRIGQGVYNCSITSGTLRVNKRIVVLPE